MTANPSAPTAKSNTERYLNAVLLVVLAGTFFLAWFFPRSAYYSQVHVKTGGEVEMIILQANHPNEQACIARSGTMVNAMLTACKECSVTKLSCTPRLEGDTTKLFAPLPISEPSATFPNGYVIFRSKNPEIALAACQETERQAKQTAKAVITCLPSNTNRPAPASKLPALQDVVLQGGLCFALALLVSWLMGAAIVRYEHLHAGWSMDHTDGGPQKFHATPTPRIGGLCIAMGLLACAAVLPALNSNDASTLSLLLVAGLAPFIGGFSEDLTKKTGIFTRLLFTMIGGALAAWMLGAVLNRLDIPWVDNLFAIPAFAIAFTVFAAGGVANSINIIDGFNGLASGFSLIASSAFAYVAYSVGAMDLLLVALALMGTLIGFLIWNYPHGKIFLGDGGAYLVGFLLAAISILMVAKHPEVSPWFPVVTLIYPIFETLFSAYRRSARQNRSPGRPDGLHLHSLLYRRTIRGPTSKYSDGALLNNNHRVAPRVVFKALIFVVLGAFFWTNSSALLGITIAYCVVYLWLYERIIKWRTPHWLHKY